MPGHADESAGADPALFAQVLPGPPGSPPAPRATSSRSSSGAEKAGDHCRAGLEDKLRFDPTRLAASNAKVVKKIVDVCERYERRPAMAGDARGLLGLQPG